MKRENLIRYMANPASLDSTSLPEVEGLIQSYPYFQTAHMLLARNHHNLDSVKYHDLLRSAAAFAGDRTILYHLIHSRGNQSPEQQAESSELSGRLADILRREIKGDELEMAPAYSVEDIPVVTEPEPSIRPDREVTSDSPPSMDEYTFTGWFDNLQGSSDGPVKVSDPDTGTGGQSLIDKFLEESPVVKPDPERKTDPADRSEASGQAGDTLMTETLARIYVKQGKFRKAIYAYEKLSLKYPEKSIYFASQINRIKSNLEENI